jgi:hypothetical protein
MVQSAVVPRDRSRNVMGDVPVFVAFPGMGGPEELRWGRSYLRHPLDEPRAIQIRDPGRAGWIAVRPFVLGDPALSGIRQVPLSRGEEQPKREDPLLSFP